MELALGSFNLQGNFTEERLENILRAGTMDVLFFSEPRHVGNGNPYRHVSGQGMSLFCTNLVGIALRPGLPHTSWGVIPTRRAVWVTCTNYMYISVYLPTSASHNRELTERCYAEISELMRDQRFRNLQKILAGDFNARCGFDPTDLNLRHNIGPHVAGGLNANSEPFLNFLIEHDLCIPASYKRRPWAVRWSWRHQRWGKTYEIDHFVCPYRLRMAFNKVAARPDLDCRSDHRLIFAKYDEKQLPRRLGIRRHRPRRHTLPREPTALTALDSICSVDPCNVLSDGVSILRSSQPPKTSEHSRYLSEDYRTAKTLLTQATVALRSRYTRSSHSTFLKTRRRAQRIKRRDMRRFSREKIREANELLRRGSFKQGLIILWNLQRTINPSGSRRPRLQAIYSNSTICTSPGEIAAAHADFLRELWKKSSTTQETRLDETPLESPPPTIDEIQNAIRGLKLRKAPGPDGVKNEAMKSGNGEVARWTHRLLTCIWRTGKVPRPMSQATVVMIRKPGKDPSKTENYRPISLLPSITKTLESVVHERIKNWYSSSIGNYQAGFMKNKQISEHTAALRVIAEQTRAAASRVVCVLLDLKKAYDSVDREALFRTLSSLHLPPDIRVLLSRLYANSECRVRVADCHSAPIPTSRGVMQGSVLSPLLFNILLESAIREASAQWDSANLLGIKRLRCQDNDIFAPQTGNVEESSVHVRLLAYADDISLLCDTTDEACLMVQILGNALTRHGLQIAPEKSTWIYLGLISRDLETSPITCNIGQIPYSAEARYLGLSLNEEGDDERIAKDRIKTAWRRFWQYKTLLLNKNINVKTRFQALKGLVFSTLLYGSEVLTLRGGLLRRVNIVERSMLRRIAGVRKWDEVPTEELRQKLGATGLTLAQEQRRRRMRFVGHVLREPTSIINQLLRSTAPGQKKGRKKCFLGEVATEMNTLKERKYGGEGSHTELASNREVFRQRVWEFVSEGGVLGKLMCDKCGKEYIYKKCYETHILKCMHVTPEANFTSRPTQVGARL